MRRRGFTLIELLVSIAILAILMALIIPAVGAARESARRTSCRNHLKQIGLALHLYHETEDCFPSGYIYFGRTNPGQPPPPPAALARKFDAPPPTPQLQPNQPGWGWAALLLPYLDQGPLHSRISFGTAVEDPASAEVRTTRLPVVNCPSDRELGNFTVLDEFDQPQGDATTNSYAACFGSFGLINTEPDRGNGIFQRSSRVRTADVTDGVTQTIAIGERSALFAKAPWAGVMTGGTVRTTTGAPVYTAIVELSPAMVLARIGNRSLNSPYSEPYDFFSPHAGLVHFAFADGRVRPLSSAMDQTVLHALATRNGDEPIGDY